MACLSNCFRNADRHTDSETRERFGPKEYTFRELADATGHFSNSNSLGEGGFGQVYRGILDGKEVAVKKLKYLPNEQPSEGLLKEIEIVSSVIHKNLVKLLGYCIEGDDILLVLEYFPQKSLNFHLHGNKILEWKPRMKIAKGSAEALTYLHGGCKPKIIHRDVTSSNILLDDDLEAKVTDFGLALFFPETGNLTHISRSNKGTDVYADPDPQNYPSQKVSERSDVYSYGVVLLELITGRKTKFEGVDIVTWAKPRIEHALHSGDYSKLVDSKLQKNYVEEELKAMVYCAAACLYKPSKSRPLMKQIVRALESCKDIEDIWDEKSDNQFLTNDPRPNGTYNLNNFQHMLPKPLVISEAYNGIEFTQQGGLYNASNGTERFKAYFRKGYQLRNFSYQVLTEATGGFSEDNRLDEGPLGQVYMGTLNGEKVAIKKFNNPRKQEEEYKHMKAIGSDFHHRNLLNLIGYCEERANRLLVYEFVPHCRSFRCSLKDESSTLNWSTRYRIFLDAVDIKRYLFSRDKCWWGGDQDWKDYFFLDDDFRLMLAEYGREKFSSDFAATSKSTRCTAPEYTSNRTFTQKTDVYSYGVMLVEMITGKEPDDDIVQSVVPRLKMAQSKGNYDFVDKRLKEYDKIEMDRVIACALACLHDNPQDRPEMNQIIEVLKGNIDPQDLCKRELQLSSGH